MGDNQCGLCLSCGAPFMPELDQTEFFNRDANLSILFLNTQFRQNPDIMRSYDVPKLCSRREASHMIHRSYHHTALDYMCNGHRNDSNVGVPAQLVPGFVVPNNVPNQALLYFHTATGNSGARSATWTRPPVNLRIDMRPLLNAIRRASAFPAAQPIPQSLTQVYDMCAGCNALMTQKSHMRFLLGVRNAGAKNNRGRILPPGCLTQRHMDGANALLPQAYGRWRVAQNPRATQHPSLQKTDSDTPAIAYYLHMCLPFRVGPNTDGFHAIPVRLRAAAREHYLVQCWLVLEIACLATLLRENTLTKPRSRKSHGMHQHLGALDVYVSYFLWRMVQFRYATAVERRGIGFIQWHQKFFCDARNCPFGLLREGDRLTTTGQLMFGETDMPSKALVQRICRTLVRYYKRDLVALFRHVVGSVDVDRQVFAVFVFFCVVVLMMTCDDDGNRSGTTSCPCGSFARCRIARRRYSRVFFCSPFFILVRW